MKNKIKEKFVRSPLNYLGNKYRILNDLVEIFPKEKENFTFIDVFGGSFNVGINSGFKNLIYNEIDVNVFNIIHSILNNEFDFIDSSLKEIIKKFSLEHRKDYKKNKESYLKLRDEYNKNKNLFFLITLMFYSFNSEIRFNSKGFFNVPIGKSGYTEFRKKNLLEFKKRAENKKIIFFNYDFEILVNNILKIYQNEKIIFYFDPPYLISNATYNSFWTEREENRFLNLLNFLNEKNIKFIVSNFIQNGENKNEFLLNFLNNNNLNIREIKTNYKNSNYQRKNKITREIIFWNYEK